MCRHIAYLGRPVTLASILVEPPHGLVRQASHPRHQANGRVNADGFGVGWYDHNVRPEPARYRRATPIWADRSLTSFAPLVRTTAMLAAVRNASPGLPVEESGNAPFTSGPWLFSLNGLVFDWHDGARTALRAQLSPARADDIEGASDTELLFGLFLDGVEAGSPPDAALSAVVAAADATGGGRLNLLATDGQQIVATVWGDTLFIRTTDDAVVVASEPWDDDEHGWKRVPDRTVIAAVRTRSEGRSGHWDAGITEGSLNP